MSNDTIEITTKGGKKVVIRNYTTHGDDKQANALLDRGSTVTMGEDGKPVYSVTLEASEAAEAKYVELLVQSIDGGSENIPDQLDQLRSEDYAEIKRAVRKITTVPKAMRKS